jgi:hypothetical protein
MAAGAEPAVVSLGRTKLAKTIGMVGSSSDGEALVAARKADAMIRAAGKTWSEVLNAEPDDIIAEAVEFCLRNQAGLSVRESDFLGDIAGRHELTENQRNVLRRIWRKARLYARASEAA